MRSVPALKPLLAVLALAIAVALPSGSLSAQNDGESFTAFAINMNAGPGRNTATLDIKIDRWSSDADRERLLGILREEKDVNRANKALLRELQNMPKVGYIRTPTTLAWDLRYARQNPLPEGGRQIVLGTDRPIGFREARNQPRTIDYPFTVIEMRLDKNDRGEGKLLAGTKLYIDQNKNLVLENYGIQPVMLNEIKKLK
jgi:hypothetical protein